jgi:NADH:ubiquinone oxidoreductase subunit E
LFANASHNSRLSVIAPAVGRLEVLTRVTELIADLKPDDVDLLKGLHRINHEFHYIPRQAIPLLAQQFQTTPAIIYGTIDFYSELRMTPPAENVVEWCSGPACLLKGSAGIRRALEATLGCGMDEASIDGKFELRLVQCDGTCHLAPLIRHKGKYIGPLTTSEAIEFARSLGPVAATPATAGAAGGTSNRGVTPDAGAEATSGLVTGAVPDPRPTATPDADPSRGPGE